MSPLAVPVCQLSRQEDQIGASHLMSNDELHDFSDVTPQEWRRLKVQVEREHTLTQWVDDQDGVVPAPHSENGPDSRDAS